MDHIYNVAPLLIPQNQVTGIALDEGQREAAFDDIVSLFRTK